MDHRDSLVPELLMGVRIPQIVLVSVSWESPIRRRVTVVLVVFTNVPSPFGNHVLFLRFGQKVEHE